MRSTTITLILSSLPRIPAKRESIAAAVAIGDGYIKDRDGVFGFRPLELIHCTHRMMHVRAFREFRVHELIAGCPGGSQECLR